MKCEVTLSTVNTNTEREMAPKLAEEIAKLRKEVEQVRELSIVSGDCPAIM